MTDGLPPLAARLVRALELEAEPRGDATYLVIGDHSTHVVADSGCDCRDALVRGRGCKHLLAVALQREPLLRQAIGQLVAAMRAPTP